MLRKLIEEKASGEELTQTDYYSAVEYLLHVGPSDSMVVKFFLALNSYGMSKKEVLYLALALRDSGKVINYEQPLMEKHSTGGIGDSTSVVLVPLLASMGYKIIKTSGKSLAYTNGSTDRFTAISNFNPRLNDQQIKRVLDETNGCVLSHIGDVCPADRMLFSIIEKYHLENDINLLASSIACKKLASGAKYVLVDVKYGIASVVKTYRKAKSIAKILKYVFASCGIKATMVITNTEQTIGSSVGNAIEVVDAINVLHGERSLLRDISVEYATELVHKADPKLNLDDIRDIAKANLDNGSAFESLKDIVKNQGGSVRSLNVDNLFKPYSSVNFVSERAGYVGNIDTLLLGELVRRLCCESHDNNIGVTLKVKIGDYVNVGDVVLSFYYKDIEDLEKYKNAISGVVRLTDLPVKPVKVIKKVIR